MSFPFSYQFHHGGGAKGIALCGALSTLQKANALRGVSHIAGVSGGAIIAFLYSLGYKADELKKLIRQTDFSLFEDDWDPFRIVSEYGLYRGQALLNWLNDRLVEKGYPENCTFEDLQAAGCVDLSIYATDLSQQAIKVFSFATAPKTRVAEAVRASISIPLFFHAWQFSNQLPDDHLYVDGTLFTQAAVKHFVATLTGNTLLLYLKTPQEENTEYPLQTNEIYHYTSTLFDSLLKAQLTIDISPHVKCYKVSINDFGFAANYFKISSAEKKQLILAGQQATQQFLDNFASTTIP